MKKPTLDSVFKKAKSTVRKAWSQAGYYAEDDQGNPRSPTSPDATKFCVMGACERHGLNADRAMTLLEPLLPKSAPNSVAVWNDRPTTKKKDVLSLFDRAIKKYKGVAA